MATSSYQLDDADIKSTADGDRTLAEIIEQTITAHRERKREQRAWLREEITQLKQRYDGTSAAVEEQLRPKRRRLANRSPHSEPGQRRLRRECEWEYRDLTRELQAVEHELQMAAESERSLREVAYLD